MKILKPKVLHVFKVYIIVVAALLISLASLKALAQPSSVHSDLPLWTDTNDLYPLSFNDEDGFGCAGLVKFGNWKLTYFPENDEVDAYAPEPEWLKIHNYGVFHCAYGFRWSHDVTDSDDASSTLGHIVELGMIDTGKGQQRIWAIQSGFRPGSDYIFLSRSLSSELKTAFNVLDILCPKRYLRTAGSIDIFDTQYCAINNKRAMRRFAKRMAKLPPIGKLEYVNEFTE